MPVWIANNKKLRDWLRKDGFKKLAVAPGFAFEANIFENAKTEVIRQHEEETDPDHRTAYRLLTRPKPKPKIEAGVTRIELPAFLPKWLKASFGILVLVLLSVIAARGQTVIFKDEGTTRVRRAGGQVGVDFVGAGVSCAANVAGITTCTISGGGATGYQTIEDEGSALTQRTILNFLGAGVSCVDNVTKTDCTISGGGGGSWSDLTAPTAAVNLVADALAELVTFDFQANYTTEKMVLFKTSTGTPSGGTLFTLEVHDPDVLPFAISDGTNTVFQVERDADTTVRNFADQALNFFLDCGDTAAQNCVLGYRDRSSLKWELRKQANDVFTIRDVPTNVTRVVLALAGENDYRSGSATADHLFKNSANLLRLTLHGDSDKISFGSAVDATINRTAGATLQTVSLDVQGGIDVDALAVPAAPTITPQGTPGTTTWGYKITAVSQVGETLGSTEGTTTTGNATLDGTNFNRITWSAVSFSKEYNIYRTTAGGTPATTGLIGTVAATATLQLDDTGLAAGAAEPTLDSSGDVTIPGRLVVDNFTLGSVVFAGASGVYTQDNANLFWDDTGNKLGIGTAIPGRPLHIVTSFDFVARFESTDSFSSISIRDSNTTAGDQVLIAAVADDMRFRTLNQDRMTIQSTGNVGIGTTAPATSALLELSSTTGALLPTRVTTTQRDALTAVDGMILYNSTLGQMQGRVGAAWVDLGAGVGSTRWDQLLDPTAASSLTSSADAETITFDFQSSFATDRFIITDSVGNPTAGTLLQVTVTDPQVEGLRVEKNTTDEGSFFNVSNSNTASRAFIRIISDTAQGGIAAYGSTHSTAADEVWFWSAGASGKLLIRQDGAKPIEFWTNGSERGTISSAGAWTIGGSLEAGTLTEGGVNVVVDTDSPNAAGDISGDYSAGLTIDAGSVASAELATPNKTINFSFELPDPVGGDDGLLQHKIGFPFTIVRISCSTDTGTVPINVDERVETTPNTAGVNALSSDLVCDTNSHSSCASGCDVNTITNGPFDADDPIGLILGVPSGSPTIVRVHVEATID